MQRGIECRQRHGKPERRQFIHYNNPRNPRRQSRFNIVDDIAQQCRIRPFRVIA